MKINELLSKVLYVTETQKHGINKCTVKNTYEVFENGSAVIKYQMWNTFCFIDDFGNLYGISDKGKFFNFVLSDGVI